MPAMPPPPATNASPHVLVLLAHPDPRSSRVNRRLANAVRDMGADMGDRLDLRDLYALYPDYAIDIAAEQTAAAKADLIVWQHPLHWYGMPPLLKLWLDEVLALGWAYGSGGTRLAGKDLWVVCSTGGHENAYRPDGYNRHFFDAFLPPYEQTAALCGMRFLPPLVIHGAHTISETELSERARVYADRLASYPDWPELEDLPACLSCELPDADRPAGDTSTGLATSPA